MDMLKAQISIFCIEYNWGNLLDLKHTLDRKYLMSILYVECLQISLHAAY